MEAGVVGELQRRVLLVPVEGVEDVGRVGPLLALLVDVGHGQLGLDRALVAGEGPEEALVGVDGSLPVAQAVAEHGRRVDRVCRLLVHLVELVVEVVGRVLLAPLLLELLALLWIQLEEHLVVVRGLLVVGDAFVVEAERADLIVVVLGLVAVTLVLHQDVAHAHRVGDPIDLVVVGGGVVEGDVADLGVRELLDEGHEGIGRLAVVLVLLEVDLDDLEGGALVDLGHLPLELRVPEAFLVEEELGVLLQVVPVLVDLEGVEDEVGRLHGVLAARVQRDDLPEQVGRLLELVLVVQHVRDLVEDAAHLGVVLEEAGVLHRGVEELLLPARQLDGVVLLPALDALGLAAAFLLDHLVGREDRGLGAEAGVLALGIDLDDPHVLDEGLVVLLGVVQQLPERVADLVGVLVVGEVAQVDGVGLVGEVVGLAGAAVPRLGQRARLLVVVRGGLAEHLLDDGLGLVDGVLVGGVCPRPRRVTAVLAAEAIDLLEDPILLAHLAVGLDDVVLVVGVAVRLGILEDQATVGLDGLLVLALLEVQVAQAAEHGLDEVLLAELGEVLVGLVHLAGVGEEADQVLEGLVFEVHLQLVGALLLHRVGHDGLHRVDGLAVLADVVVAPGQLVEREGVLVRVAVGGGLLVGHQRGVGVVVVEVVLADAHEGVGDEGALGVELDQLLVGLEGLVAVAELVVRFAHVVGGLVGPGVAGVVPEDVLVELDRLALPVVRLAVVGRHALRVTAVVVEAGVEGDLEGLHLAQVQLAALLEVQVCQAQHHLGAAVALDPLREQALEAANRLEPRLLGQAAVLRRPRGQRVHVGGAQDAPLFLFGGVRDRAGQRGRSALEEDERQADCNRA